MLQYTGTLIKEGVLDQAFLNFVDITAENEGLITFLVGEDLMPAVAEEISQALKPRGFYATIENEYLKLIIFPNKIFKFKPNDAAAKQKAIEYGKSLDILESQLKAI